MKIKDIDILKYIILNEEDDKKSKKLTFEEDPMGFILKKYITLNSLLEELMTPSFKEYLDGIYIMSPKPTTFRIVLHNKRYFFLTYLKNAYEASIGGKRYYLLEIGEKERCMLAISKLLQYGSPIISQGPEGAEESTRPEEEGEEDTTGGSEADSEKSEKPLTERLILEYLIKEIISKKDIINKIISSQGSDLKLDIHTDPERIKNVTNISNDEFKDIISKSLGVDINSIQVIEPKNDQNTSSRFYKFIFPYEGTNREITLAGNKIPGEKIEKIQIEYINSFIEDFGEPIDIIVSENDLKNTNAIIYKNISGVEKIPGNKPADFKFLGEEPFYIQHKDYPASQQYCGYFKIKEDPEVHGFIEDLKKITNEFKPKEKYTRGIINNELKKNAVYGIGDTYGENRVKAIYFGNLKLEKTNNPNNTKEFKLISNQYFTDETIPYGDYEPYLFATYRLHNRQEEIKYCRIGVYPKKFLKATILQNKNDEKI